MPKIIGIETTGKICSVSLFDEDRVINELSSNKENQHSAVLHTLIENLLKSSDVTINELDAIALSKGPGSYTGLRIGSSAAKGLCVALNIPLIAIPTHYAMLYNNTIKNNKNHQIICLTDARRDDVFMTIYNADFEEEKLVRVVDLTEEAVQMEFNKTPSLIIGSGAEKAKILLSINHEYRLDECLTAQQLRTPALNKFEQAEFEDIYHFEPAYEKQFYTVPSKKKLF